MKTNASLFRWLVPVALADWLVMRTVTRAAIHIPKSPAFITIYRGLSLAGQIAASFAALLALATLLWIAWHEQQRYGALWLSLALAARAALALVFLVVAPAGWPAVAAHLLTVVLVGFFIWRAVAAVAVGRRQQKEKNAVRQGVALLLPALALLAGTFYQAMPLLYEALRWPGPAAFSGELFNAGELLVLLSVVGLWWGYGRTASTRIYLFAALPALFFTLTYLRDPAMTAILTIWSTGLTLYLPWPLYSLGLWLAAATVLACIHHQQTAGWALLLLLAAGYAPQLSTQVFLGMIALWLLSPSPSPSPLPVAQNVIKITPQSC